MFVTPIPSNISYIFTAESLTKWLQAVQAKVSYTSSRDSSLGLKPGLPIHFNKASALGRAVTFVKSSPSLSGTAEEYVSLVYQKVPQSDRGITWKLVIRVCLLQCLERIGPVPAVCVSEDAFLLIVWV